jgi:methyl-accepting chemotaxis protein
MRFFQRRSLQLQLLTLILIPIIGMLALSAVALSEARRDESEGRRLAQLTTLSVSASALVHEIQKERGLNSGFLGSEGREFRRELTVQRRAVDDAVLKLKRQVASLRRAHVLDGLEAVVEAALQDLEALQFRYRDKVEHFEFTEPDAIGAYSAVNARLIDLTSLLATESHLSFVNNPAVAYTSFIKSKERAGIERSLLANTFASGHFPQEARIALNTLITEQDAYLDTFLTFSDIPTRERYAEMVASPIFDKTFAYRSVAISHAEDGEFGVTAGQWYRDQTAKIDALKDFEDGLAERLMASAEAHAEQTSRYAFWLTVMTLLVMVVAKLANRLVRRTLLARLGTDPRELSAIARRIAANDLSTDFSHFNCKPGSVINDMKTMQELLLKRREDPVVAGLDSRHSVAKNDEGIVFIKNYHEQR